MWINPNPTRERGTPRVVRGVPRLRVGLGCLLNKEKGVMHHACMGVFVCMAKVHSICIACFTIANYEHPRSA